MAHARWLMPAGATALVAWLAADASAQLPVMPVIPPSEVKQAQDLPTIAPPVTPGVQPIAPSAPAAPTPAPEAAPAAPGPTATRESITQGSGATNAVPVSATTDGSGGGAALAPAAANAPDIGSLLQKSDAATGVEFQQRNSIISDPRIRGLRNGQYYALSDGAPFFPARLDLDTPVSKFDPSFVRDVVVVRGPYTALLGPAFSFLDIGTLNTPRSRDGCGTDLHGITAAGYQTNGNQWNGLQTITAAGQDWGFRGSYNVLQGNDFRAGDGSRIPASYLSHNFNFAFGYDLAPGVSAEFKALRSFQYGLEFPGLFFDIARSDTEAYSLRLTAENYGPFDLATFDLWYNSTAASGDTLQPAKQRFVNTLLRFAYEEPTLRRNPQTGLIEPDSLQGFLFKDNSTTRFAERSIGYRLAGQVGNNLDEFSVTAGTDLNTFGQGLSETIRFAQLAGPSQTTGRPVLPTEPEFITQNQGIPNSNSTNVGLFLQTFTPVTDRWALKSGGRVDGVFASTAGPRLITGNANLFGPPQPTPGGAIDPLIYSVDPSNPALDRQFLLLSGFATAEYKVTESTTLFLAYGYAERAPTITELYAAGPFIGALQQGTTRLIGDPNLSRERLNQFDVGLRFNTEYLKAGISGFYAVINDYITFDANRVSPIGLGQLVYTNTDRATLAGTEMYAQVNATSWLSPFATLSYVQGVDQTHIDNRRGTVDPTGTLLASSRRRDAVTRANATATEPLPQIPPLESRLGFRIHAPTSTPAWQVEFAARIVTGQNKIAASLGEIATPGFTTFDIRGYWQPRDQLILSAGVENLGDKLYREHLDPVAANQLQALTGAGVPQLFRIGTNFFFRTEIRY